jgi:hypothetical protein
MELLLELKKDPQTMTMMIILTPNLEEKKKLLEIFLSSFYGDIKNSNEEKERLLFIIEYINKETNMTLIIKLIVFY